MADAPLDSSSTNIPSLESSSDVISSSGSSSLVLVVPLDVVETFGNVADCVLLPTLGMIGVVNNFFCISVLVKVGLNKTSNVSLFCLSIGSLFSSLVNSLYGLSCVWPSMSALPLAPPLHYDFVRLLSLCGGMSHFYNSYIILNISMERVSSIFFPFRVGIWFTPKRVKVYAILTAIVSVCIMTPYIPYQFYTIRVTRKTSVSNPKSVGLSPPSESDKYPMTTNIPGSVKSRNLKNEPQPSTSDVPRWDAKEGAATNSVITHKISVQVAWSTTVISIIKADPEGDTDKVSDGQDVIIIYKDRPYAGYMNSVQFSIFSYVFLPLVWQVFPVFACLISTITIIFGLQRQLARRKELTRSQAADRPSTRVTVLALAISIVFIITSSTYTAHAVTCLFVIGYDDCFSLTSGFIDFMTILKRFTVTLQSAVTFYLYILFSRKYLDAFLHLLHFKREKVAAKSLYTSTDGNYQ